LSGCDSHTDSIERLAEVLGYTPAQAKAKDAALRRSYSITLGEYHDILQAQGNACGCCGTPYSRKGRFCVDHEHAKGLRGPVRGILCFYCNVRRVRHHKLADVQMMLEYLENPPALAVIGVREAAGNPRRRKRRRKAPRKTR
jgi:hypothetical protein